MSSKHGSISNFHTQKPFTVLICRPDCFGTQYDSTVTAVPFRKCDNKNLGISDMCTLTGNVLPNPPIFGQQLFEEYDGNIPKYLKGVFSSNRRKYDNFLCSTTLAKVKYTKLEFLPVICSISVDPHEEVFQSWVEDNRYYDAYENDIAMVHFYFKSPTVFQYKRAERMTEVEFLSQVKFTSTETPT